MFLTQGRMYVFYGNKTSTQFLNFSTSVTSTDILRTHILLAFFPPNGVRKHVQPYYKSILKSLTEQLDTKSGGHGYIHMKRFGFGISTTLWLFSTPLLPFRLSKQSDPQRKNCKVSLTYWFTAKYPRQDCRPGH